MRSGRVRRRRRQRLRLKRKHKLERAREIMKKQVESAGALMAKGAALDGLPLPEGVGEKMVQKASEQDVGEVGDQHEPASKLEHGKLEVAKLEVAKLGEAKLGEAKRPPLTLKEVTQSEEARHWGGREA